METYSVATNNRFALFFDEEDDPGDVIATENVKPEKVDKEKKRADAKSVKAAKAREAKEKALQALAKKSGATEAANKRERCGHAACAWGRGGGEDFVHGKMEREP